MIFEKERVGLKWIFCHHLSSGEITSKAIDYVFRRARGAHRFVQFSLLIEDRVSFCSLKNLFLISRLGQGRFYGFVAFDPFLPTTSLIRLHFKPPPCSLLLLTPTEKYCAFHFSLLISNMRFGSEGDHHSCTFK